MSKLASCRYIILKFQFSLPCFGTTLLFNALSLPYIASSFIILPFIGSTKLGSLNKSFTDIARIVNRSHTSSQQHFDSVDIYHIILSFLLRFIFKVMKFGFAPYLRDRLLVNNCSYNTRHRGTFSLPSTTSKRSNASFQLWASKLWN